MTELMLEVDEIERLTGWKQLRKQIDWCRRNGVRYRVNDAGELVIARANAEKFLGVTKPDPTGEADLNWPEMRRVGIVGGRGET